MEDEQQTQDGGGVLMEAEGSPPPEAAYAVVPVMSLADMALYYDQMQFFIRERMISGIDFGVIPGTDGKPTLLKPGAEKLLKLFGIAVNFEDTQTVIDFGEGREGGEPFFMFRKKAIATHIATGRFLRAASGSANSFEKKWRWRDSRRVCPACGKATIIKGREEYGGGWLCFAKQGGCGEKFIINDDRIVSQATGQVANPDIYDLLNTIEKIAEKRALVGVAISACNASEYFSQDIDDPDIAQAVGIVTPPVERKEAAAREPELPRPYTPEQFRAKLAADVAKKGSANRAQATDKQKGYVAALMNAAFKDGPLPDRARYTVMEWLFGAGKASTDTLSAGDAGALIGLLKEVDSYSLSETGVKELQAIYRQAMIEAGQGDMFGDEPLK